MEMFGTIIYANAEKGQALVGVKDKEGLVQKYFLLYSRIARSPEVIKVGQFVKFSVIAPPPKPGLLPLACGVEVSDTPFTDSTNDVKAGA